MKKYMGLMIAGVLISLSFIGCVKPPPPSAPNGRIGENAGGNGEYPQEVAAWLENMKPYFAAGAVETPESDATFFIVNWGEKPTGGYDADIKDIEETRDKITVKVQFTHPEGMVTQALTYPYAVKTLDRIVGDKPVEFIDIDSKEYIPRVVGIQPTTPFKKASENIKILDWDMRPSGMRIRGIARAFEATVSYAFESRDGEVLKKGFVTAQSGGPDWGYFSIEETGIPEGSGSIVVFTESAKDGSRQDAVFIDM